MKKVGWLFVVVSSFIVASAGVVFAQTELTPDYAAASSSFFVGPGIPVDAPSVINGDITDSHTFFQPGYVLVHFAGNPTIGKVVVYWHTAGGLAPEFASSKYMIQTAPEGADFGQLLAIEGSPCTTQVTVDANGNNVTAHEFPPVKASWVRILVPADAAPGLGRIAEVKAFGPTLASKSSVDAIGTTINGEGGILDRLDDIEGLLNKIDEALAKPGASGISRYGK